LPARRSNDAAHREQESDMKKLSLIAPLAMALAMTLALSACGGGGDTKIAAAPPSTPSGPVGPSADAFVTYVLALIGVSDETSEPIAIDTVVATAPEDTEPVVVK